MMRLYYTYTVQRERFTDAKRISSRCEVWRRHVLMC